jgi:hypothetical protein
MAERQDAAHAPVADDAMDDDAFWALAAEVDGLILGPAGELRFTAKRRSALASYFGMAGVDLRTVKTKQQYLEARERAAPYFQRWLEHVASRGDMTPERRLLIAVVRGDERLVELFRRELQAGRNGEPGDG